MKNKKDQRRNGLIGLYSLLLLVACSLRQLKNHFSIAIIVVIVALMVAIILWRYLKQKAIIQMNFFSFSYDSKLSKEERIFLSSLTLLIAPVLKVSNISIEDVVLSALLVVLALRFFVMNERYLLENKKG